MLTISREPGAIDLLDVLDAAPASPIGLLAHPKADRTYPCETLAQHPPASQYLPRAPCRLNSPAIEYPGASAHHLVPRLRRLA